MKRIRYGLMTALLLAAGALLAMETPPDLTALRAAAEAGNPEAQYDYGYALWIAGGVGSASRQEGLMWLRRAAAGGHVPACRELGMMLLNGNGLPPNREEGLVWLTKAGEGGDGPSLYHLGLIRFTAGDREAGLVFLQRAADAGYPRALRELAEFKANGLLPCTGWEEIRGLLERASAGGDGEAGFILWQQLWQTEGIPAMVGYLRAAADRLYMPAVREYGALLFLGRGIQRDREGGIELIRLAALSGEPEACYLMSVFAENGELGEEQTETASDWLKTAAGAGSPIAQRVYGERLLNGDAAPDPEVSAYEWITRAALQGDSEAQWRLARHCLHGEGEPRDFVQAARWTAHVRGRLPAGIRAYRPDLGAVEAVRASAEAGEADACRTLAELYRFGDGVPRDPARALGWYQKAAEAGDAGAQAALGYILTVGEGVPSDSDAGYRWLTAAAAQNEPVALVNLALIHARGIGRPVDPAQAAQWAARAAEAGPAWGQLCSMPVSPAPETPASPSLSPVPTQPVGSAVP